MREAVTAQAKFNDIVRKARREAYCVLELEARMVLPLGWRLELSFGWGVSIYDAKGLTVYSRYTPAPWRLPKGVRKLLDLACDFADVFEAGNETIKGVPHGKY